MNKTLKSEKIQFDCPVCNTIHEVDKIIRLITSTFKGCKVEHEETVLRCPQTNEEWYYGKMLDDSLANMRNAYRIKNNLLTSGDIISIRKKYKLNQKEFSQLLGLGDITIARYENKLIQDEVYDSMMRMAGSKPSFALEKLIEHKNSFADKRFNEIKSILKKIVKCEGIAELKRQELLNYYLDYDEKSEINGFTLLDINKISDVAAYFANYINNLYKVKLMKLLWYVDMLFFKKYNHSITGLVYLHMPFGALPIGHNEIIYLSSVSVKEEETETGAIYHIEPLVPPVNPMFSLEEQEILSKVASKFKNYNSKEIISYMHNETAYKNTSNGDIILYNQNNVIFDF